MRKAELATGFASIEAARRQAESREKAVRTRGLRRMARALPEIDMGTQRPAQGRTGPKAVHSCAPGYPGVLQEVPGYRVIVAASGARYYVQRETDGGEWFAPVTWAVNAQRLAENLRLRFEAGEVAQEVFALDLDKLPDEPRQARFRSETPAERAERERLERLRAEKHPGELYRDRKARIVRGEDDGWLYAQKLSADGEWRTRGCAPDWKGLTRYVIPAKAPGRKGKRVVRSDVLRAFVEGQAVTAEKALRAADRPAEARRGRQAGRGQ